MRQIRRLSDEEAVWYYEQVQSQYVVPTIFPAVWIFADLRLRLLVFMNIKPTYFHQRHQYPANQRRLLDLLVIGSYEGNLGEDYLHKRGIVNDLRYNYLKFLYQSESNKKHEWVKVNSSREKIPIYIWHEDVEEYHRQKDSNNV
jgi:hypothetical protein